MADLDHWFATCDDFSLCRGGGNGPINATQIMPIVKFVQDGDSFLDLGCGSGTSLDALMEVKRQVKYKGIDFVEHRVKWLKENFKDSYLKPEFEVGDAGKVKEEDKSWDIVWSRHVIDHLPSFEASMDEHCRIAKKRVICVLWLPFNDLDDHIIKNIVEGPVDNRTTYKDEYYNQYSRKLVMEYLENKKTEGWEVLEFKENCDAYSSKSGEGKDIIIVLERKNG